MLELESIKNSIIPFVGDYAIKKVAVFGSVARGQDALDSDIDLLMDFGKNFGVFDLIRLKQSLEDEIGRKIDIVEYSSIDPLIKDAILKEAVVIYG